MNYQTLIAKETKRAFEKDYNREEDKHASDFAAQPPPHIQ